MHAGNVMTFCCCSYVVGFDNYAGDVGVGLCLYGLMVSLQSPSRLVKLCVVSGAVTLVSFLAYYYTSLPYFSTKCLQDVDESQNLVTTMTAALIKMLQESTDMKPHNVTADCKNIWKTCRPENCSKSISQNAEKRIRDLLSPKLTLNDQDQQDFRCVRSRADTGTEAQNCQSVPLSSDYIPLQRSAQLFQRVKFLCLETCTDHGLHDEGEKASRVPRRFYLLEITVVEFLDRGDKLGLQIWGGKDMHNIPVTTLKG
ncbi:hypothetical protein Bpfe_004756, partial [Biomphalaria pfeifferi]